MSNNDVNLVSSTVFFSTDSVWSPTQPSFKMVTFDLFVPSLLLLLNTCLCLFWFLSTEFLRRAGCTLGLCKERREQDEEPLRKHHSMYVMINNLNLVSLTAFYCDTEGSSLGFVLCVISLLITFLSFCPIMEILKLINAFSCSYTYTCY